MSNAARKQQGLDCEDLRTKYINEHLPLHDFHLNLAVMYQEPTTKRWYPATIKMLYQEPRSYIITTKEGVHYRKTQAHLKSYQPQDKTSENEVLVKKNHMWTVKNSNYKQSDSNLAQSRPRKDIKPPIKLDL